MPQPENDLKFRSLQMWLHRDLSNWFAKVEASLSDNSYTFFNYTTDCCQWKRYRRRNFFTRLWSDSMSKNVNFQFVCPFKKGFKQLYERNVSDLQDVPFYSPSFVKSKDFFAIKLVFTFQTKEREKLVSFLRVEEKWGFSGDE